MAVQQLLSHLKMSLKNSKNTVLTLIFAVVILKLSSLYWSVNVDDGNWEQFKTEHKCLLLTSKTGTQRLSWQCDDGKVYYRWRQQR